MFKGKKKWFKKIKYLKITKFDFITYSTWNDSRGGNQTGVMFHAYIPATKMYSYVHAKRNGRKKKKDER